MVPIDRETYPREVEYFDMWGSDTTGAEGGQGIGGLAR
jgi:hypothetical protein